MGTEEGTGFPSTNPFIGGIPELEKLLANIVIVRLAVLVFIPAPPVFCV
jgi:hypothetical protein